MVARLDAIEDFDAGQTRTVTFTGTDVYGPSDDLGSRYLYNRYCIPARDAAGISGRGAFHRLRNTLGSLVHGQADKTARQLADWLGHGDLAFSARVYTGQMDDGLGKADFLDEVIPVEKWATDGQPNTHKQPQTDQRANGERPHSDAGNGEQPQVAANAEPDS